MNRRVPKIFNLRLDPYERADVTSNTFCDWLLDRVSLLSPAQEYVVSYWKPSRNSHLAREAASFNLDTVMSKLKSGVGLK